VSGAKMSKTCILNTSLKNVQGTYPHSISKTHSFCFKISMLRENKPYQMGNKMSKNLLSMKNPRRKLENFHLFADPKLQKSADISANPMI